MSEQPSRLPPRRQALERIGIFGTLALVLGFPTAWYFYQDYQWRQLDATHEGPLKAPEEIYGVIDTMALLPKPGELSSDSIRLTANPLLGKREFAVALSRRGNTVKGWAVVVDRASHYAIETRRFSIGAAQFAQLMREWDARTDGYRGDSQMWTDGTVIRFERKRGDRVTSGSGNSPCQYDVLGNMLAVHLASVVPELADLRNGGAERFADSDHC